MTAWVRAGLVAALFSGAPSTARTLIRGDDLLASTEAVGHVVVGTGSSRSARIVAGAAAHLMISLGWAWAIDRVLRPVRRRGAGRAICALGGAALGGGIAALDLGVIGRRLPSISSLESGPQIADHLAFGAIVGLILGRRR